MKDKQYPYTESQSILGRMLKLFRMRQFTGLVNKKTKEMYVDPSVTGFSNGEEIKFPTEASCIRDFEKKLHYFKNTKIKAEANAIKTAKSCLAKGYVKYPEYGGEKEVGFLQVNPDKGEDFIEMWYYGFIREAIVKEWKVATIFFGAMFSAVVFIYRLLIS